MEEEVTELISQVHMGVTVQLESRLRDPGVGDALHPVPAERQRNLDRHAKSQAERTTIWWFSIHRKRKPAHLVLRGNAEGHREDPGARKVETGELIPSDERKAEAVKTLRTTVEGQKPQEWNAWVKASRHLPTFERHRQPYTRKKHDAGGTNGVHTCRWRRH